MRTLILAACLVGSGCSTISVSHVRGSDYKTAGVRYWLPAPYLLVKTPVEISRTETLFSLSPIDNTVLRRVLPCDDGQAPCRPQPAVPPPPPVASGIPPLRPGMAAGSQSATEDSTAAAAAPSASGSDHVVTAERDGGAPGATIVWLPDYCQQYAISEKAHAGSQKVQIQLAEGWKLTALNTEINNTEVLQKMFDTISSLAGSMISPTQKLASAGVQTATGALERGAQGGRTRLFRRTQIITFRPGLYPLLQYPQSQDNEPDCARLPSFRPPKDATEQNEFWSELVSAAATSVLAAPVEPGRPASMLRPPGH